MSWTLPILISLLTQSYPSSHAGDGPCAKCPRPECAACCDQARTSPAHVVAELIDSPATMELLAGRPALHDCCESARLGIECLLPLLAPEHRRAVRELGRLGVSVQVEFVDDHGTMTIHLPLEAPSVQQVKLDIQGPDGTACRRGSCAACPHEECEEEPECDCCAPAAGRALSDGAPERLADVLGFLLAEPNGRILVYSDDESAGGRCASECGRMAAGCGKVDAVTGDECREDDAACCPEVLETQLECLHELWLARLECEQAVLQAKAQAALARQEVEHARELMDERARHLAELHEARQAAWDKERQAIEAQHAKELEHQQELAQLRADHAREIYEQRLAVRGNNSPAVEPRTAAVTEPASPWTISLPTAEPPRHPDLTVHIEDLQSGRVHYGTKESSRQPALLTSAAEEPVALLEQVEFSMPSVGLDESLELGRLRREVARLRALVEDLLCIGPDLPPTPVPQGGSEDD